MHSIRGKPQSDSSDEVLFDEGALMQDLILESALLPILESALRSGSLLEMAKETQLYHSYLDLIAELA